MKRQQRHQSSSKRFAAAALPAVVPVRRLRPLAIAGASVLGVLLLAALAISFNIGSVIRSASEQGSAIAGFSVEQVEIHGINHTRRIDVHSALTKAGGSLLFASVDAMKQEVEQLSWVRHATVARQLPNRLVVVVEERKPFALWQRQGQLALIDSSGHVLQRKDLNAYMQLPLVVGEGADQRIGDLFADLDQVPALRASVDAASWIGNRRWDVRFRSGETLQLPEGRRESQAALVAFAQLNAANSLLGKGISHFDMRVADRLFVRPQARDVPASSKPVSQTSI